MMRVIGHAELEGMDLRRRGPRAAPERPELDWLERHPVVAAVVIMALGLGTFPAMIAILYAIGKARGM